MSNQKRQALQQTLSVIFQLIQAGEPQQALHKLKPLLRKWPQNADVNHLAALVYKSLDDQQRSQEYFLRTLALNEQQPQVHNNLANLYKSQGDFIEAEKHYLKALSLQVNYPEAMRNLALCYSSQNKYEQAIATFESCLKVKADDLISLTGLADCYRELGSFDQAQKHYQEALNVNPEYVNAWFKMGQNKHMNADLEGAVSCYQRALEIDSNKTAVLFALGSALHEIGSSEQAIALFETAIKNDPSDTVSHERLNQILWESGRSSDFGNSYRFAIAQNPELLALRSSYISQLIKAGDQEHAVLELNSSLKYFGEEPTLLGLKAGLHADQLEFDLAADSYRKALADGFDKENAQSLVKVLIIQAHYLEAQTLLDELLVEDKTCQLSWGLQGLVWRLTDNSKHLWLNDYEQFVRAYTLKPPAGYASSGEFLDAIRTELLTLHKTQHEPLEQTLRNGTQTAARLLHRREPVIQALKQALQDIADEYVQALPDDDHHPLLSRKSQDIKFSGSWSVKLRPNGFHVNHLHPAGWISSSCYISIPASMRQDGDDLQGCIKFGESPLALGDLEVIEKVVRPEEGMVVLFPSYMWHGTYPFDGEEHEFRLTSPFDVSPA